MNDFLALLLEKFKAANPKIWAILAFLLSVAMAVLTYGADFHLWEQTPLITKIAQMVTWAAALVIGSRTARYLPEPQRNQIIAESKAFIAENK